MNNSVKYKIRIENITKTFLNGKILANSNINLKIKENEIHALIGENGAGKSTLMSILFGLYEQDSGNIYIDDELVKFTSAKDSHKYKIGMVHQHFKLVENYTVFQNIILGVEKILTFGIKDEKNIFYKFANKLGVVEKKNTKEKLNKLIDLYGFNIDLNQKISNLSVGEQQKTEILKLLFLDSEILIFDEPTAVLSDNEITSFLKMIKNFKEQGKTIIIISHKLNELKEVADYGTVIRHGKVVGDFDVKSTSIEKMAELMVGRSLNIIKNESNEKFGDVVLSVKDLPLNLLTNKNIKVPKNKWLSDFYQKIEFSNKINNLKKHTYSFLEKLKLSKIFDLKKPQNLDFSTPPISFDIKEGEIFAIAGVQGNGQSELIEYIAGIKKSNIGTIKLSTPLNKKNEKDSLTDSKFILRDISKNTILERYKLGMSFIPEDRQKYGLFLDDSIAYNSVMDYVYSNKFTKFGFLDNNAINDHALKVVKEFDVRGADDLESNARGLSGGNQQKLIVGREIIKNNRLIIFAQPTRGLDIGAIEYIHSRILQAKKEKKAILLISYELDEIFNLADTIAVISKNQILECDSKKIMTRNKVGVLMASQGKGETNADI